MKLKIKEILCLDERSTDGFYDYSNFFEEIFGYTNIEIPDEINELVRIKYYTFERLQDCRCREVNVLFFKDKPIVMFQYIGKGKYENINIIDKNALMKIFIAGVINSLDIKENNISINKPIHLINYNMQEFKIEDNKLISVASEELIELNKKLDIVINKNTLTGNDMENIYPLIKNRGNNEQ